MIGRGLSDLSVASAEFSRLNPPVKRVFITENDVNGLAFPPRSESLVIFGLGYGLERLAGVRWFEQKTLYYWGNVDTHGRHTRPPARGLPRGGPS